LPYLTYEDDYEDEAEQVTLPCLTLPYIYFTLSTLNLPLPSTLPYIYLPYLNLTIPYMTLPYVNIKLPSTFNLTSPDLT